MTYNSITSTQPVTFSVTGPTLTPTPTGVEQVAIDYTYDPSYRLTRAQYAGGVAQSYAYSYDAVGNRTVQTQTITSTLITNYSYDIANRLTSVNGVTYSWDDNGNLLNDGLQAYTYDQANRLKTVTSPQSPVNSFGYIGLGDRLSQTVGIMTEVKRFHVAGFRLPS